MNQDISLHIACGCDERYVPHLAVMLRSLLSTASRPVRIYLMDGGLPDGSRRYLQRVVGGFPGSQIETLNLDPSRLRHLRLTGRFTVANYFRVLLPELLPQLDRVLYLDADIVVAGDVAPLWDTDLGGCAVAAVANGFHPKNPKQAVYDLGLARIEDYFNSGVLLLDLAALRTGSFSEKVMSYAEAHPERMLYADQDALNAIVAAGWRRLHPRWNLQSTMLDFPDAARPAFSAGALDDAMHDPAVIHYVGWWKPWRLWSKHPFTGAYRRHYRLLPRPVVRPRRNLYEVVEYYFPDWVMLAYLRWRPRLSALRNRLRRALPSRAP